MLTPASAVAMEPRNESPATISVTATASAPRDT